MANGRVYKAFVSDVTGGSVEYVYGVNILVETYEVTVSPESGRTRISRFQCGDIIEFGRYQQRGNSTEKEPIEWVVLDVRKGNVLLLSKQILDYRGFVSTHGGTESWENSDIRKWLNSDFLSSAFSDEEKKYILRTPCDDWERCVFSDTSLQRVARTDITHLTFDKVFLLSISEACESDLLHPRPLEVLRNVTATSYAESKNPFGRYVSISGWWLRTSADFIAQATYIHCSPYTPYNNEYGEYGEEQFFGPGLKSNGIGVRPAIWVDMRQFSSNTPQDTYSNENAINDYVEAKELCAQKDYKNAVALLQRAAEYGYADAQYRLGTFFDYGYGIEVNAEKASHWYLKAAEQGHADAQADLGYNYMEGIGVAVDYQKALYWIQKAVEQNHDNAMVFLGGMYEKGLGVYQNYEKCFNLYKKAAEMGNVDGCNNTGIALLIGRGVERNPYEAAKWNILAAEKGHKNAQFNLANQYLNGDGVSRDEFMAFHWMKLAATNGHPQAIAIMQQILGE